MRLIRTWPSLLGATCRGLPWPTLAGGAALAVLLVAWPRIDNPSWPATTFLPSLRLAMLVLAGSAAAVLDDPAAATIAASPVALVHRRLARLAWGLAVAGAGWATVLVLASSAGGSMPVAGLTVEWMAWLGLALAVAAATEAIAAPGVLLVAFLAASRLPEGWALLAVPGGAAWVASRLRLALAAALSATVLLALSRDPATPHFWRHHAPGGGA